MHKYKYKEVTDVTDSAHGITISIDNHSYTTQDLAKRLGITAPSVYAAIKKYDIVNLTRWYNSRAVIYDNKLYRTAKIYWTEHNEPCWAAAVLHNTYLTPQVASVRLKRWAKGIISCDALFRPDNIDVDRIAIHKDQFTSDIKVCKNSNIWSIRINGKHYTISQAVKELGITYNSLSKSLSNMLDEDEVQDRLNRMAWKYDNYVPQAEKVYVRYDGKALSVSIIQRTIDITGEGARKRLSRWASGNYSTKEIFEPIAIDNKKDSPNISLVINEGDLMHLSSAKKHCPAFKPGKYDELLQSHHVGKINTQTANGSK